MVSLLRYNSKEYFSYMYRPKLNLLAFFCLLCSVCVSAQSKWDIQSPTPRLVLSVGSHQQFVAFEVGSQFAYDFVGVPVLFNARYNLKSFGSKQSGIECRLETGITGSWGNQKELAETNILPFKYIRNHHINYGIVMYADDFTTTQVSGILRYYNPSFVWSFENDFFTINSYDKFRTGAALFAFRIGEDFLVVKNLGWTGDPYSDNVPWIKDSDYPAKYGYKDMSKAPLGDCSAGVFSIGYFSNRVLASNLTGVDIGVDHDRIRHLFQNRLIHDSPLINNEKKGIMNPHIPMLDKNDLPYLFLDGQELKKAKLYIQASFNNFYLY